jgi:hypothetical protein
LKGVWQFSQDFSPACFGLFAASLHGGQIIHMMIMTLSYSCPRWPCSTGLILVWRHECGVGIWRCCIVDQLMKSFVIVRYCISKFTKELFIRVYTELRVTARPQSHI